MTPAVGKRYLGPLFLYLKQLLNDTNKGRKQNMPLTLSKDMSECLLQICKLQQN
jgi:hypothetical protein